MMYVRLFLKKKLVKKFSSHKTRVVFRRSTVLVSIITSLVTGWCNYQKRCVNEVRPKEDYGEDFGTQSYHKINEQWEG